MIDKTGRGLFSGRPALKSLTAYAAGIAVAQYLPALPVVFVMIGLGFTFAAVVFSYKNRAMPATILLYIALLAAGVSQYQMATSSFPPTHICHIARSGGTVTAVGKVAAEPDVRSDKVYLNIELDSLLWRKRKFESSGRLLLKINQPVSHISYGDHLRFKGYLFAPGGARNPGGFDFARWLGDKEIYGMIVLKNSQDIEVIHGRDLSSGDVWLFSDMQKIFINKIVVSIRKLLLDGYDKYLPAEHASLLAGFVLGEKRDMSPSIVGLFRDTGTLHLMAVSGSNVAIVAGFFFAITFWVTRKVRILITLVAVVFFCFLTRNEPSVVRASVMATIGLLGFYRQKNPDIIGLLSFSGLVLLIINPLWLFNIGFQLSFAACAGIVYLVPFFTLSINHPRGWLSKIIHWTIFTLLATLAAQIAVLPLTAQYFNRLPMAGVLANLPMIGLAGVLTVAGVSFLPFIMIGGPIAAVFGWTLSQIISFVVPLLRVFADLPGSVINVQSPGWLAIILFYAALYFLAEAAFKRRLSFKGASLALISIAALVWLSYLQKPEGDNLTFIDCGPDRAVLYSGTNGERYLWFDCYEKDQCSQLSSSLVPYLLKSGIINLDTVFTEDKKRVQALLDEVKIDAIVQSSEIKMDEYGGIGGSSPYFFAESILNKTVKFVGIKTDNNIETKEDGHYYELSTEEGTVILAGTLNPRFVDVIARPAKLVELPWTAEPYGAVYECIRKYPPEILVFSPDKVVAPIMRDREQLTYYEKRTWTVSMAGGFRVRSHGKRFVVDHMLEP